MSAWRAASPHWSAQRERTISSKFTQATSTDGPGGLDSLRSFETQWLNRWPSVATSRLAGREEPLLPADAWPLLVDLTVGGFSARTVVAVETHYGRGCAVAVATDLPEGRVAVWGHTVADRSAAWAEVAHLAGVRPGAHLLVGGTLESDEKIPREVVANVSAAGSTQTRTALPLLRELAEVGRLRHDGGTELAEQVAGLLVVPSPAGGLTVSTRSGRTDLARAAAWAVQALAAGRDEPLEFFVY